MTDLTILIRQFTRRYRTALLLKFGLLLTLTLGILGVLAWRLQALPVGSWWSIGMPSALATLILSGLAWWLRRRWISDRSAPAYLDQALGLQQRLLTAAEFSKAAHPSPLYSLLLDDTAQRYAVDRARFPKPLDRTAGALIAVFILLLMLPGIGRAPIRLAQLPHPPVPPQLHPPEPPPPDQPRDTQRQQQQQQGASTQSPSAGMSGANQQSGGAGSATQLQSQQSGSGSSASNANQSSSPSQGSGQRGQGQGQQQNGQGQGQPQRGDGTGRASSGANGQEASPGQDNQNHTAASKGAGGKEGASASTKDSGQGQQQAGSGRGASQGGQQMNAEHRQQAQGSPSQTGKDSAQSGSGQQSPQQQAQGSDGAQKDAAGMAEQAARASTGSQQAGAQGQPQQASASRSPGTGGSSGNQEAMKAEIQQLLQQVSGELKDLQAQLASANEQMRPQAGTGTDTQLYEAPMPAPSNQRGADGSLPMPLETDTAPTKAHRPGGGVGQTGAEVSQSAPQMAPEDAQLSQQPLEESATSHQAVPPEYRGIFGNLHQHPAPQPSQAPASVSGAGGQTSERRE